jgi:hypothetical protein
MSRLAGEASRPVRPLRCGLLHPMASVRHIPHPAINSAVLNGGERLLGTHDNPVRSDHGTRWFASRLQTAIGMKIA